jgi:hypothetical protein
MTTIAASKIATIGPTIGATLPDGAVDPILAPDNPDLVVFYTMDRISGATLVDESPNANNGTITGATAVAGQIGNALRFDGVNDKVDWGITGSTLTSGAISYRVRRTVATEGNIITRATLVDNQDFLSLQLFSDGTVRIVAAVTGETTDDIRSTNTVTLDDYAHIVIQSNGSRYEIYLNGAKETLDVQSGVNRGLFFGSLGTENINSGVLRRLAGDSFSQSDQDQIRLFNRELTQPEITALFNEGAP